MHAFNHHSLSRHLTLDNNGPEDDIPSSVLLSVSGDSQMPGNMEDFDYYHGVGKGGAVGYGVYGGNGGDGGSGAAIIIARVPGTPLPSKDVFFYTG